MASTADEAVYVHKSVIHGYHIYKAVWTPVLGEVHRLEIEEGNEHNHFAAFVKRGDEIIGHVPRELSSQVWHFLRHRGRTACEVIGKRKRGDGLVVPCKYRFIGRRRLIKKLEVLLQN